MDVIIIYQLRVVQILKDVLHNNHLKTTQTDGFLLARHAYSEKTTRQCKKLSCKCQKILCVCLFQMSKPLFKPEGRHGVVPNFDLWSRNPLSDIVVFTRETKHVCLSN